MKETEKENIPHYFICLPYLNLGDVEQIDLGFAKIWNFNLKAGDYITDPALKDQVVLTLNSYRTPNPFSKDDKTVYSPIKGMGIISTEKESEKQLDKIDREKVNDARLILFISFLARNNTVTPNANYGHSMASSENFAPVHFSVVVGSQYITEHAGFAVRSWHGGIDINKNMFIRPRHVPTPRFNIEADLINALTTLRLRKKKDFRKIISAIEVFYESFYNSPEVSHNARILLQASAFEILLNTKNGKGRKEVKAYLKRVANYPDDKIISFKSERDGKFVTEKGTVREKWADSFFTLRNHIIHGNLPKDAEYMFGKWQRHFDIALYFFIFCIKRKIEESLKKDIFGDDVSWKTWTDDLQVPPQTYTGFEYDHYGRRGWERIMQKAARANKVSGLPK